MKWIIRASWTSNTW